MKVHFLKSATTLVESGGVRILTDPWLVDGEYYGSWYHYPPYEFDPANFCDVDYIYISHIHPDHFSPATLSQLDKNIPVLIHSYEAKFLRRNIESLGFSVTELEHNQRVRLKGNLHINILAADNCDPQLCMKFLGCGRLESEFGSSQIDSLSVIDDGQFTLVNINDCPFALARTCCELVVRQYQAVDMLFVGYAGAGPYPQCFSNLSYDDKRRAADAKRQQFLDQGLQYLRLLEPNYFMPFAGTYTLGGRLARLNDWRGVPEIEEALTYLDARASSHGVLLNSGQFFDLASGQASAAYVPTDLAKKQQYVADVIARNPFHFDDDIEPTQDGFLELVPKAFHRMDEIRRSISFETATQVVVPILDGQSVLLSMDGSGWSVIDDDRVKSLDRYVQLKVDPRLLARILEGPRLAHWNNAEIGSHIEYFRKPDTFERGLYHCMNFFHV